MNATSSALAFHRGTGPQVILPPSGLSRGALGGGATFGAKGPIQYTPSASKIAPIAIGVLAVGAIAAIFFMTKKKGRRR